MLNTCYVALYCFIDLKFSLHSLKNMIVQIYSNENQDVNIFLLTSSYFYFHNHWCSEMGSHVHVRSFTAPWWWCSELALICIHFKTVFDRPIALQFLCIKHIQEMDSCTCVSWRTQNWFELLVIVQLPVCAVLKTTWATASRIIQQQLPLWIHIRRTSTRDSFVVNHIQTELWGG